MPSYPNNKPEISVIMSVYNADEFIDESIESILNQTFHNFEFIIVDDGSIDQSWSKINKYADRDSRIVLLKNQKNLGLPASLNICLSKAKGRFIARQDADDISLPNRLEIQSGYLKLNTDTTMVSSGIYYIDKHGIIKRRINLNCEDEILSWHLLFYNYIRGHSQVMYRRKAINDAGGYDESFRFTEDYELWTRLFSYGRIHVLKDALIKYRQHEDSITGNYSNKVIDYSLIISQRHIESLIGEKLNIIEIYKLFRFWTANLSNIDHNENNLNARDIHKILEKLLNKFTNMYPYMDTLVLKKLKAHVALQFMNRFFYEMLASRISKFPILFIVFAFKWQRFGLFKLIFWKLCNRYHEQFGNTSIYKIM